MSLLKYEFYEDHKATSYFDFFFLFVKGTSGNSIERSCHFAKLYKQLLLFFLPIFLKTLNMQLTQLQKKIDNVCIHVNIKGGNLRFCNMI